MSAKEKWGWLLEKGHKKLYYCYGVLLQTILFSHIYKRGAVILEIPDEEEEGGKPINALEITAASNEKPLRISLKSFDEKVPYTD